MGSRSAPEALDTIFWKRWSKEELEAIKARCREIYSRQEEEEEEDWPCCNCCGMGTVQNCHHHQFQDDAEDSSTVGRNASFTPLLNFKDNHQLHDQLRVFAQKAVAYFNNKNNENLCFEDIERVACSNSDGTVYLLAMKVRDSCNADDLKILQAKVLGDSEELEINDCKLETFAPY